MNSRDPTGTTCTVNDGKAACKVDDPGKLSKKEISKIEKVYTKAVNKLLKDPNRKVTISVKGKSFSTTAGTVAKGLVGARVAPGEKTKSRASTAGGTLNGDRPTQSGGTEIYIHRPAIAGSEHALSRTIIHEGFHTVPEESVLQPLRDQDNEQFQKDHRAPYNDAAEELLRD